MPLSPRLLRRAAFAALVPVVVGCATSPPAPVAATTAVTPPTASAAPVAPPAARPATQAARQGPSRDPVVRTAVPRDTRTGRGLRRPYQVRGIVVVSKDHRLSSQYRPASAGRKHGLRPDVLKAAERLMKDAQRGGLTLRIRSGYRSYGTQAASYRRALATYPDRVAKAYYAPPGASEHQTGLALDLWDGRNRGTAFTRTPQARWIAKHAREYGFIVRYPKGREEITGFQWEPWHLRYVGRAVAADIGPNQTLEEYLGLD